MKAKDKIRGYIEDNLSVFDDEVNFSDEDNIFQMGFVNSLFAMKLLSFVQQEFEIEICDDEIDLKNFSSINNVINLIKSKRDIE
ncbi:phosphopantetheine binding protein [Anaerobacterium chartisolvens]|uniref:Phosphopantetheine binding protein n=1 Tax=Anaerobacterium chartisolvens TaxID=1297424 RepID=A0A369B429_9FIRM|nr:acyl carrier protein [Anaerobacterium chartisolvens]RCX16302.1 phosphopantetheine binding protein [Anaerobacterium chartisolvens]